jgi:hypothetical protein
MQKAGRFYSCSGYGNEKNTLFRTLKTVACHFCATTFKGNIQHSACGPVFGCMQFKSARAHVLIFIKKTVYPLWVSLLQFKII